MLVPLFPLLWLFFCYSFLGWVLETAVSAVRLHRYVDRSVLFGPLCACYGITAVLLTVGLPELRGNYFFLFLGSAICSTVVEWIAGHLLEKATHTRWWDYSNRRGNLDGYICVGAFLLWGVLGLAAVQWINPLLLALYRWLPPLVGEILLWVLLALLAADIAGTVLTLCGVRSSLPPLENLNSRLAALSVRLGEWILRRAEGRIQKAHPGAVFSRRRERTTVSPFARGASFYSILLLFFIGGVAGDLAETIFCRLKMGWWMSRSSVVWGPFSIVWGLALAAATLFLYKYRDRSASFFFVAGTLLGGLYEYLCSVFTELVFGTVFWDYSAIPFNLGGRINLLYCFFWGFAAVAWFRGLYPILARWIAKIPPRPGKAVVWLLIAFMSVNMAVSGLALAITCADAMAKAAAITLLALEKTNGSGWMVVKIAGDVASVQAAVMTGAELAERQQGLVAQKVIARPGEGLLPARVQAPSPAPDVMDERRDPADTLPRPAEQVTCNLCLDPHCPRQKGEPRSQCLHAGKRGDA